MFFILRFLLKTRSRMPVRTQTPTTSAVMAAHVPKGTAMLLIVIHLILSAPLMTTPQPLLPSHLELS